MQVTKNQPDFHTKIQLLSETLIDHLLLHVPLQNQSTEYAWSKMGLTTEEVDANGGLSDDQMSLITIYQFEFITHVVSKLLCNLTQVTDPKHLQGTH